MQQVRIVSLLPSATEILFAIGAGDDVVGVTFECDYPAEARTRSIVSTSSMPEGLTPTEIDAWVSVARSRGEDLYRLDADSLRALDPDLIVTQDLCAVCAVDVSVVEEALDYLGCEAEVITLDPQNLQQVLESITTLGAAVDRVDEAAALVASLRARLAAAWRATMGYPTPRVALLEWTDPPYAPGHWLPEMVELGGAVSALGTAGSPSTRVTWDDVRASSPDLIVAAPCGYDLDGAAAQALAMPDLGVPVWAVDANASFARPGPRLVDGIEAIVAIVHPHRVEQSPIARQIR